MVKTCCAPQCHNKSKQPGISFFCFPKHPTVRREWIRRLKKENFEPTRHTVLCSQHFDSSCFLSESVPEFLRRIGLEQRPVRRRLRHGALPTLLVRRGNRWAEEGGGTGNGTAEDTEEKEEMEGEEEEEEEEESSVVIKEEPTDESYAEQMSDASATATTLAELPFQTALLKNTNTNTAIGDDSREAIPHPKARPRSAEKRNGRATNRPARQLPADVGEPFLFTFSDSKRPRVSVSSGSLGKKGGAGCSQEFRMQASPLLCHIDPEFCQFQPVFQTPFFPSISPTKDTVTASGAAENETPEEQENSIPRAEMPEKLAAQRKASLPPSRSSSTSSSSESSSSTVDQADTTGVAVSSSTEEPLQVKEESGDNDDGDDAEDGPQQQDNRPVDDADDAGDGSQHQDNHPADDVQDNGAPSPKDESADTGLPSDKDNDKDEPEKNDDKQDKDPPKTTKSTPTTPPKSRQSHGQDDPGSVAKNTPSTTHSLSTFSSKSRNTASGNRVQLQPVMLVPVLPRVTHFFGNKTGTGRQDKSAAQGMKHSVSGGSKDTLSTSSSHRKYSKLLDILDPEGGADHRDHSGLQRSSSGHAVSGTSVAAPGLVLPTSSSASAVSSPCHGSRPDVASTSLGGKSRFSRVAPNMEAVRTVNTSKGQQKLFPKVEKQNGDSHSLSQYPEKRIFPTTICFPIFIRREHIMEDFLDVYNSKNGEVDMTATFRLCTKSGISLVSPKQCSILGNWNDVTRRKMFALFWRKCADVFFEGNEKKVPKVINAPDTSEDVPYVLGRILRHGLTSCGYWPMMLSPACAVSIVTGNKCSDQLLIRSLRQVMFEFERQTFDDLRESAQLDPTKSTPMAKADADYRFNMLKFETRVSLVLQAYGGAHCKVPQREEAESFLTQLAVYYLHSQPYWWMREMRRGLLSIKGEDDRSVHNLTEARMLELYSQLEPSPGTLLHRTVFHFSEDPELRNSERRVRGFFERCLFRMSVHELTSLLMLWTDTDCLLMDAYSVTFTVTSAGGPAPPRFLGARNTLVLGSYCPSFDIFHAMFVRAVKEAYEEELAMLEKWPSKENA